MTELIFEVNSNKELYDLFDKELDFVFIHKFSSNETMEWWNTDLKTKTGIEFKDISVRQMEMDIQTDLDGLKKILELNTRQLRVYQFDKKLSGSLYLEHLPENNRNRILKQAGLKHFFFINFEFLTINSFDPEFINRIESNPKFEKRIAERKQKMAE